MGLKCFPERLGYGWVQGLSSRHGGPSAAAGRAGFVAGPDEILVELTLRGYWKLRMTLPEVHDIRPVIRHPSNPPKCSEEPIQHTRSLRRAIPALWLVCGG